MSLPPNEAQRVLKLHQLILLLTDIILGGCLTAPGERKTNYIAYQNKLEKSIFYDLLFSQYIKVLKL